MRYKTVILTIITIFFISILAACGGSTKSNNESNSGENKASSSKETFTLKLADYHPATNDIAVDYFEYFIKRVDELTDGRVKVEFFPAEQLGKADQMLDIIKSGTADMAALTPSYISDKLPLSTVIDLPNMYNTSTDGSEMLWNLIKKDGALEEEMSKHNITALSATAISPNSFFTRKDKVETIDDLKGMKLRAPGGLTEIIVSKLGATPVKISASELYTALERNTVDGGLLTSNSWKPYQIDTLAKYAINNMTFGGGSNILAIRNDSFEKLPEDLKKAMSKAAEDAMLYYGQKTDEKSKTLKEEYTSNGIEFYDLSDEQVEIWTEKMEEVNTDWVKSMEKIGVNAQDALDAASKLKK